VQVPMSPLRCVNCAVTLIRSLRSLIV
jgi:hypothetical protein